MSTLADTRSGIPALVAGGTVHAIVPQSVEEIWRVSTMVISAGLAPTSLVGTKTGKDAASAVSIAIMAGAELGLPPMVALRSFTVINGRPALYGDGIINVARRSRKAEYIRTGYDDARQCGWCEAKRSDTGEEKRTEFSVEDAKRAGLWDDRDAVKRKGRNGEFYDAKNDSPWHRYPQRMLQWRAAGYCLRELFADVLGGITDEYEAREIGGDEPQMRDITPPAPPPPPEEGSAKRHASPSDTEPDDAAIAGTEDIADWPTWMDETDTLLRATPDEPTFHEVWTDRVEPVLSACPDEIRDACERLKAELLPDVDTGDEPPNILAAG